MPARARHRSVPDIWPGFVDAISAMLIIVIFLLLVFTLAQSFLSKMLSGRDEALDRLNRQVAELADMLSLERQSNTSLRNDLAQLSSELQSSIATRDSLSTELAALKDERDDLANTLALRIQEKNQLLAKLKDETSRADTEQARADKVDKELEDAFKTISADREKIRVQLLTLESLKRDIAALQKVKGELETKVTGLAASLETNKESLTAERDRTKELTASLDQTRQSLTAERDRTKELVASLSSQKERTALAQKKIEDQEVRLAKLQHETEISAKSLTEEQKTSAQARAQVELLNRQLAALRQQLSRISAALEASEAKSKEQEAQIVNLGSRLNAALANKVEELARYRSEFFGKLREVLGNRDDIRVEGDRFVFQSEVLFSSGSADLVGIGRDQIHRLATTLKDIARRIPPDIDWVLRVDGHTDRIPIHTAKFPSNWELSTARAVAVVKMLIEEGLPPRRLAAAGFGEYRPLDVSGTADSLRRNRRIEFKLTGR